MSFTATSHGRFGEGRRLAAAPGVHGAIYLNEFDLDERKIIYNVAKCFYVTNAWTESFGSASYKYLLLRPSYNIEHAIPSAREIVFLFSPYESFEARTLGAYSKIGAEFEALRINSHFRILCSKDKRILQRMQQICVEEPDIPVTIPFTYEDLLNTDAQAAIVNGARESYHFRDLFAQRSPLQNDTYFFGRSNLVASIRDRISRGENSGVFGLRKSGKTSVLLALSRATEADGFRYGVIDCQSPSISAGSWTDTLREVCVSFRKMAGLSTTAAALGDFSERSAAQQFEKHINDVYSHGKRTSVVAFDEIEHISPYSGVALWRDGERARYLWQTIRAYQQRFPGRIAFVVAGTNPSITEVRQIAGTDNPLLEYVHSEYLGGLPDADVQRMCDVIGGLMGMEFQVTAVAALVKALGGQPFLTRQVCSHIHKAAPLNDRPFSVDEYLVYKAMAEVDFKPLVDDILGSLKERYPDEFECLEWISTGHHEQAQELLGYDPSFLRHLEGYGVIEVKNGQIRPRLGIVMDHLRGKAAASALHASAEERWAILASKRGRMEVRFRAAARSRLIDREGKTGARDLLLLSLTKARRTEVESFSLDQIFSSSDCKLFWTDLIRIVDDEKEYWSRRMGVDYEELRELMNIVNETRRVDAHAKSIDDLTFDKAVVAIEKLEEAL